MALLLEERASHRPGKQEFRMRTDRMKFFKRIDESNKLSLNKPVDQDRIYYSELTEWFTRNAFRSFSIKYVIHQNIYYRLGRKEYNLHKDHYMIGCKHADVQAYFTSKKNLVKSICIDICPETVSDAYRVLTTINEDPDRNVTDLIKIPQFDESIYPCTHSDISNQLHAIACRIRLQEVPPVNKEWFLLLSEKIVLQKYGHLVAMKDVNAVRMSTRNEICRRLEVAKDFIEENYLSITHIREIATACNMSEFHFFRRFKQVYRCTPLHLITRRKMEYAKKLLTASGSPISEIAFQCNYPDVFTFSKTFKKFYGLSPATWRTSLG